MCGNPFSSAEAKLHSNDLMYLGSNSASWNWTSVFVSRPNISRSRGWSQGCLSFPTSCVASVAARCVSAERQEASVCCCCWEAGCWQGHFSLKTHATAVSLCYAQSLLCSESRWWAEATMLLSVMDQHAHTDELATRHTPVLKYQAPLHCSYHQCITTIPFSQNKPSAHRLSSLGFITFII